MGFYKIRGALQIGGGGSVNLGADANLYRNSANVLKTDDDLIVAGALTATGAQTFTGLGSFTAGLNAQGGTKFVVPYATASPTVDTNGHLGFVQKSNRSYLLYQAGGTPCYITLPQVTGGTMAVTVGGTP